VFFTGGARANSARYLFKIRFQFVEASTSIPTRHIWRCWELQPPQSKSSARCLITANAVNNRLDAPITTALALSTPVRRAVGIETCGNLSPELHQP
jgi:hypothetical protein